MSNLSQRTIVAVFLLIGLSTAAFAQAVRPQLGRLLDEAADLMEYRHDFVAAFLKVKEADAFPNKTPHEEYEVAKNFGLIALHQPKPDYAAAAAAYDRQIASGGVEAIEKPAMYDMAARAHLANKDYGKAIDDIIEVKKIRPLAESEYLTMALTYFEEMDFARAIQTTKAGIAAETAAKREPASLRSFLRDLEAGARPGSISPATK